MSITVLMSDRQTTQDRQTHMHWMQVTKFQLDLVRSHCMPTMCLTQ